MTPHTIGTVGHSTRSLDEFVATLNAFDIDLVVDVRRFPASWRLPQFGSAELEKGLTDNGIGYVWPESLGGRRSSNPASINGAWTHPAFRGYADHVQTTENGQEGTEQANRKIWVCSLATHFRRNLINQFLLFPCLRDRSPCGL